MERSNQETAASLLCEATTRLLAAGSAAGLGGDQRSLLSQARPAMVRGGAVVSDQDVYARSYSIGSESLSGDTWKSTAVEVSLQWVLDSPLSDFDKLVHFVEDDGIGEYDNYTGVSSSAETFFADNVRGRSNLNEFRLSGSLLKNVNAPQIIRLSVVAARRSDQPFGSEEDFSLEDVAACLE